MRRVLVIAIVVLLTAGCGATGSTAAASARRVTPSR